MTPITPNDFYVAVGANIRTFRKLQHITQQCLANKLCKSLACISKYERGDIAIDLHTLYQIADALQIPPSLLFPQATSNESALSVPFETLPPLFRQSSVYLYTLSTKKVEVVSSVIELRPDRMEATAYYSVNDLNHYKDSAYVLMGSIYSSESNVRIHFSNPLLKSDFMFFCFRTSDLISGNCFGLFTALNSQHRFCSSKCHISNTPIRDLNGLKSKLLIGKEDIQLLKKQHILLL